MGWWGGGEGSSGAFKVMFKECEKEFKRCLRVWRGIAGNAGVVDDVNDDVRQVYDGDREREWGVY